MSDRRDHSNGTSQDSDAGCRSHWWVVVEVVGRRVNWGKEGRG